jgi:hypothetical protein
MFQRVTPTLQSLTYSRRVTSFMPLRTLMVSSFTPPCPSGTWMLISVPSFDVVGELGFVRAGP